MPRSFLVRKKAAVISRPWDESPTSHASLEPASISTVKEDKKRTILHVAVADRSSDEKNQQETFLPDRRAQEVVLNTETKTLSPRVPDSQESNDTSAPPRKRLCLEKNTSQKKEEFVFNFPPNACNSYLPRSTPLRPELSHVTPDYGIPSVPLITSLHPIRTPLLWSPMFHGHVPSPPFMPMQYPTPAWLSPLQSSTCPPRTWISPKEEAPPATLGVLSPAEIPSPSSTTKAEEPSTHNSASVPGLPVSKLDSRQNIDQSSPLLQNTHVCCPIGDPVTSYAKPTRVKVEVINNGFGIKNPLLTPDKTPVHPDVTQRTPPSPYLITPDCGAVCSLCSWRAETPRQLHKHMKSHKEIKRFLCTVCGKGFNDTFDLKRHTRTHTGVRPYKCEKCSKAFTQRCSLESHSKKIHGVSFQFAFNERRTKMYVCEDCGHSTSDPEEHFLHLRTHHPNNPAILRCHDRRQFKFGRRKNGSAEEEEIDVS